MIIFSFFVETEAKPVVVKKGSTEIKLYIMQDNEKNIYIYNINICIISLTEPVAAKKTTKPVPEKKGKYVLILN